MKRQKQDALKRIQALEKEINQLKRSLIIAPDETPQVSLPLDALVLVASGFKIAIPVARIEEVTPMVLVSPLPHAPTTIRGTISYRGSLVPVLDLTYSFSGILEQLAPEMLLALVSASGRVFALAVHEVEEMRHFTAQDVQTTSVMSSMPSIVHCLLSCEHQAVILLDTDNLLAAGEMDLLRELLADVPETIGDASG